MCQNFDVILGSFGAVNDSVRGWFWGGWRQRRWPAEGGEASLSVQEQIFVIIQHAMLLR